MDINMNAANLIETTFLNAEFIVIAFVLIIIMAETIDRAYKLFKKFKNKC